MDPSPTLCKSLETPLVQISTTPEQIFFNSEPFPLVLAPRSPPLNFLQLQEYFQHNHEKILQAASHYGAVLFKGFDIRSPEEWASLLYKSGLKEMPYIGGAAVRRLIVGVESRLISCQVVTTNESPSSQVIPFHHELAQTPDPCSHISFFCIENSSVGGSTPILRSDIVYDWLKQNYPKLLESFETHGLRYIRVVPEVDDPESAIGRSWKSMFNVKTREEAEAIMKAKEWTWEWRENGDCKTMSKVLPATIVNSKGSKSFFNQLVAAYTGWIDKRNDPKKAVVFGNGDLLPEKPMEDLIAFMEKSQCVFRWYPGEFVIIDNSMTYHARQPYQGGVRRVVASIAKGTKAVDKSMTHLLLNSGDPMPSIGLGCWKIPKNQCSDVVYQAIKTGYRCIDEASDYGNEVECGAGIKQALSEGLVKREDLWITSKLWNTYHRKEHVKAACLRSLKDLGLEYLDLYLIHFPISQKYVPFETRYPPEWLYDDVCKKIIEDPVPIRETWEAMEELVQQGLVRNIGVCNFGVSLLRDVLSYAKIKPAVLQVELHPYNTQDKLVRFCREKGIAVTGFSPLGASSYFEMGVSKKEEIILERDDLKKIAEKHGKSTAQIILRWGVQRGTSLVVKSSKKERLKENLEVFGFELSQEEMKQIGEMNLGRRFNDPGVFCEGAFGTYFPIYE